MRQAPKRQWTEVEWRILEVWADPASWKLKADARARRAGVSAATMNRHWRDNEELREEAKRLALQALEGGLAPVYKALLETASRPGREGFMDRRLLLEMTGQYTPRSQQQVSGGLELRPVNTPPLPATYEEWIVQRASAAQRLKALAQDVVEQVPLGDEDGLSEENG